MRYSYFKKTILSVDLMIAYNNYHKVKPTRIPVPDINLNYKGWTDEKGNRYSPNDVLKNPKKYKEDYEKIMNADLSYPIITIADAYVADGIHRIVYAKQTNAKTIKAINFELADIKNFAVTQGVRDRNEGFEIIELFLQRFI